MKIFFRCLLIVLPLLMLGFAGALAATLKDAVRAELVAEPSSLSAFALGKSITVALRLRMDKDWHTYWMNPGDGRLATSVDWELPAGFKAGPLLWPEPRRTQTDGMVHYGYSEEVFLLTRIDAPSTYDGKNPVTLGAMVRWLGCRELCVPGYSELRLILPAHPATVTPDVALQKKFDAARETMPRPLLGWTASATIDGTTIYLKLVPPRKVKGDIRELYFYPAEDSVVEYAAPQNLEKAHGSYQLRLELSTAASRPPVRLRGVLSGPEGWTGVSGRAFEMDIPI